MRSKLLCVGALALILSEQVWSEETPEAVRACRSLPDEVKRLRCYDVAVDRMAGMMTVPVPSDGGTVAEHPPLRSVAADPVLRAPTVPPRAPTPAAAASTNLPMFSAKVSALSFRRSGAVNVTLDNGQVWTQYGPEGRVPLRAGDTVTIRPGLFGASVLVAPSGWITKVHLLEASRVGQ